MTEWRMSVRDADLRALVYEHGAGPGSDLYQALTELQRRRDAEPAESTSEDTRDGPDWGSPGPFPG